MRVITGKAKHIQLVSLDHDTKPLSDRAKSGLFNIINHLLPQAPILDLYAGSGALGIEALSRGAKHTTFVDISKRATESIRMNLEKAHLFDHADIFTMDADKYMKRYPYAKFNIIFFSPPYQRIKYHALVHAAKLLCPGGILIFEHHKKDTFDPIPHLAQVEKRTYGIVEFEIFQQSFETNTHTN